MSLSQYSNGRRTYMEHLAKLLAQTKARWGPVESPNAAENSFSAASFLAKVFEASEEAYPSDRSQADDIVSTASPGFAVRDLEERFLVQFTLGRLYIPAGVRRAGFARSADEIEFSPEPPPAPNGSEGTTEGNRSSPKPSTLLDTLSVGEQAALRALVRVNREQEEFSHWISKAVLEQIHLAHKTAHDETPDLGVLVPPVLLEASRRNGSDGFLFSIHRLAGEEIWTPLVGRVLALFWERLLRGRQFQSNESLLKRWWSASAGIGHWSNPVPHMAGDAKKEFLDACQSAILAEVRPAGVNKEAERIGWEFQLDQTDAENLPAQPAHGAHLLEWYQWFNEPHMQYAIGHLRTDLDELVNLVVTNETHSSGDRTIELLGAAEEKPYLLHAVIRALEAQGRMVLPAVISQSGTSSLGMKLIQEISIDESADAQWEGGAFRERDREEKKIQLWRNALKVFLGSIVIAPEDTHGRGIEPLSQVLLMAAKSSVLGKSHAPDCRTEGAEKRWRILLEFLEGLDEGSLSLILPALSRVFAESLPIPRESDRPIVPNPKACQSPSYGFCSGC